MFRSSELLNDVSEIHGQLFMAISWRDSATNEKGRDDDDDAFQASP
jgi:hypothetical protein